MLWFALGVIVGLLVATLIVATLAFFKKAIETRVEVVQKVLERAGPQPRGFVYEPPDEADQARQEIIERNRREGKDTPLESLM